MAEFSSRDQPHYANKERQTQPDHSKEILHQISDSEFCTITKETLKLIVKEASSQEFRNSNYTKLDAIAKISAFKIRILELEILLPREDRVLLKYENIIRSIKDLYENNISQCTPNFHGHNVMSYNYEDVTHTTSDVRETGEMKQIMQNTPQSGGFRLSSLPIIGGYLK